jgi:hypothetical protein
MLHCIPGLLFRLLHPVFEDLRCIRITGFVFRLSQVKAAGWILEVLGKMKTRQQGLK